MVFDQPPVLAADRDGPGPAASSTSVHAPAMVRFDEICQGRGVAPPVAQRSSFEEACSGWRNVSAALVSDQGGLGS